MCRWNIVKVQSPSGNGWHAYGSNALQVIKCLEIVLMPQVSVCVCVWGGGDWLTRVSVEGVGRHVSVEGLTLHYPGDVYRTCWQLLVSQVD